jgi:hypothetical protein
MVAAVLHCESGTRIDVPSSLGRSLALGAAGADLGERMAFCGRPGTTEIQTRFSR